MLINGIGEVGSNPDLLDRMIAITLPQIPDTARKTERDFWVEFDKALPRILGALLDAISVALGCIENVHLETHIRMADFLEWVVAAAPAIGFTEDEILEALNRSANRTTLSALESSSIVEPLKSLIEKAAFKGNTTELLRALEGRLITGAARPKDWPANPKALSNLLRRLEPSLRRIGIDIRFIEHGRMWVIDVADRPDRGGIAS